MGVKVTNRDPAWPAWLVRWLVRRACADAGVGTYSWLQTRRASGYYGRGGSVDGHGGCARRFVAASLAPYEFRDPRFREAPPLSLPYTSSVAVLAFLIRHEVAHARGAEGDPRDPLFNRGARFDRAGMEDACNEAACRFVASLAERWPAVRAEWFRLARRERDAARARAARRRKPTALERHAAALERWESKLRLAEAKVARYRALLRGAERRRLAATKNGGGR